MKHERMNGNPCFVLRPGYVGVSAKSRTAAKPQVAGCVLERDYADLGLTDEQMSGQPVMIRLHLELVDAFLKDGKQGAWIDEQTAGALKTYGDVRFGNSISRDVIVPANISLHALHYVIQQCFGWQNSHLHTFTLPDENFASLTSGGVHDWVRLIGLLLRSPLMNEQDQFWDDDYEDGSFKTYLRKKYAWPQADRCDGETYRNCKRDVDRLMQTYMKHRFIVDWVMADGRETVAACTLEKDSKKNAAKRSAFISPDRITKTEVRTFLDLPVQALVYLFDTDTKELLERLPVCSVLACGDQGLLENGCSLASGEYTCTSCDQFIADVDAANGTHDGQDFVHEKKQALFACHEMASGIDVTDSLGTPQPHIPPVADHIFYTYDFGDNWCVRISGSHNCADLVNAGSITQTQIDDALRFYIRRKLPCCIARDGLNVVDDVGGLDGFAEFLEAINGNDLEDKEERLEWARSLGWSKRKVMLKNLL